jgi:hypothetical protein
MLIDARVHHPPDPRPLIGVIYIVLRLLQVQNYWHAFLEQAFLSISSSMHMNDSRSSGTRGNNDSHKAHDELDAGRGRRRPAELLLPSDKRWTCDETWSCSAFTWASLAPVRHLRLARVWRQ